MKNNLKRITVLIFAALFSNIVFAEKILFSASRMSGKTGEKNTTTSLSGNVYIKTDSMEIQADDVELSGDDYRYIKADGKITGKNFDSNMEFECDSLEFDRITKVAVLKGNVNLDDKDNNVNVKAQIINYDQETEIAIIQIKIVLTQKDNVCSASYAVYYKKDQMLELSGNAQVKQGEDTFRAQEITFNMDTQDITLGGNVKGTVTDKKSKSSKTDAASNAESDSSKQDKDKAKVESRQSSDANAGEKLKDTEKSHGE